MSGGQPASLDSSLLARKGDATPAIQDQSPLVLRLEPNLREPDQASEVQEADEPAGRAGAGILATWRSDAVHRLMSARSGLRWAAIAGVGMVVVAVLWTVIDTGEDGPEQAAVTAVTAVTPSTAPAPRDDNLGLQLKITETPEEPAAAAEKADAPAASETSGAGLPAATALAATAPAAELPATESLDESPSAPPPTANLEAAAPASGTVLPVKVPTDDVPPTIDDLGAVPDIPTVIPKSVAPVPVPKAKPELPTGAAGPYAVQLASIVGEERAQEEAFRLQKQLGAALGGREIKVERAVVAGKGTRYRLRAGGYESLAEARAACAQAVKLKADCLALRR